jgi:hypothetical protein
LSFAEPDRLAAVLEFGFTACGDPTCLAGPHLSMQQLREGGRCLAQVLPVRAETRAARHKRPLNIAYMRRRENSVSGADLSGGSAWTLRLSNLYLSGMHAHGAHAARWPRNRRRTAGSFLGVRSVIRSPRSPILSIQATSLKSNIAMLTCVSRSRNPKFAEKSHFQAPL